MATQKLTLNDYHIKAIASLDNATPKDKKTREFSPVLALIGVTVEPTPTGARLTAMASDRCTAGRISFPLEESPSEAFSFLINSKDWVEMSKKVLPTSEITVEQPYYKDAVSNQSDGSVTVMSQLAGQSVVLNFRYPADMSFPRIERLFPDIMKVRELPAGIGLNLDRLARLAKVIAPRDVGTKRPNALRFWGGGDTGGDRLSTLVYGVRGGLWDEDQNCEIILQPTAPKEY